ncbi:serine hydrolase [Aliikangiella sp. IMCC44359]|uniref:serine hydrolase n=1 Tax=Aliikangiella sp. IMCC44359 TaxID=3459125 RepID=UPI00403ACE31
MKNLQRHGLITSLFLLQMILVTSSCSDSTSIPALPDTPADISYKSPPESSERDWLTRQELNLTIQSKASPYHNDYFMPIGEEKAALHHFNGSLSIKGGQLIGFPNNYTYLMRQFPEVEIAFVSHSGYLIPKERDIIITDPNQTYWRIILSPGKVWSEEADGNMSRASFPFILTETGWNSALNGLATFIYDDNQVSNIRVQIVQHTAPGIRGEAAATLEQSFTPTPNFDPAKLINDFEQELNERLVVEEWNQLTEQFPEINWALFNSALSETDISASGIWLNNKLYIQGCKTSYGDYPYCRFMRHGIFSATKPAAGGLAMSYLAQRYGTEILDYLIKDYVDVSANHNGWEQVRFIDALNMATGIGNNDHDPNSTNSSADEHGPLTGEWSRALTAQEKLNISFQQYGNYPWGPGEVFRYNTSHYFILSAAMDNLVRQREGIGLWQLLKENVYEPIGIRHSPMMHTTEPDLSRGVAILGVGMYPTIEDMIKISKLFHQNGYYNGEQLLDELTVRKALFRTNELGLPSHQHNNADGQGRYLMSFFSVPYKAKQGCTIHVPLLSGAGGNLVTILPNGVIALRFADAQNYDARSMIEVSGQLSPLCE